jgi:hypothetical protein
MHSFPLEPRLSFLNGRAVKPPSRGPGHFYGQFTARYKTDYLNAASIYTNDTQTFGHIGIVGRIGPFIDL